MKKADHLFLNLKLILSALKKILKFLKYLLIKTMRMLHLTFKARLNQLGVLEVKFYLSFNQLMIEI